METQMMQMVQISRRTMALTKFSAATTSSGYNGPIPWTHIMNEPGLFVTFDIYEPESFLQASSHFPRLKISHEPEVLEDINLDVLGPAAGQAIAEATGSGRLYKTPECCIIVQCPCIAMRYPTDGNQVRRFQIRLAKREEFFEALSLLADANVPTTDAGALPNQKALISRTSISSISHNDSQRALPASSTNSGVISQIPTSSRINQVCHRPSLNTFNGVFRAASQINSISSSQQQHSSFQMPASRGGLDARVSSRHVQPASGTALLPSSSAPVNAGGCGEAHINLYIPRPSTAPMGRAKTPGRDLPPERELPFTAAPSIEQATVPIPGKNMPGTTRDAPSAVAETVTKQGKRDVNLVSPPNVEVPTQRKQAINMDTRKITRAGAAEEIDTQEILAKAQTRLARASPHPQQIKGASKAQCASNSQPATASQKKRRNLRCLKCRSARTKCERDVENPEGSCRPCQAAERQCSFVADADYNHQAEKPIVQIQNSQEEVQSESQPPRRSLRQRKASLEADNNRLSPKSQMPNVTRAARAPKRQDFKRPSSQSGGLETERKRLRTPNIPSYDQSSATPSNTKMSMHSRSHDGFPFNKAKVHNKPLREVVNLPAHPRSDATTATAVTDDLDAPGPITPPKKFSRSTIPGKGPPTSYQPEADSDSQEAQKPQVEKEGTAPAYSPFTPPKFDFAFRADNVSISSFLSMHHSEQSVMLDEFFTNAIQDEKFLLLSKIMETRYEPMLFPSKW